MLSLALILFSHVPPENFLRCEDYAWLKEGIEQSNLFTPLEKFEFTLHWMEHTDPTCFDNKDAHD